jgi:hypothetical protein
VKSIRYLAEARAEFLHEIQYFARFSPRVLLPGRFKFALVYAVVADEVVIVAVAPFRRRPGNWKARVPT